MTVLVVEGAARLYRREGGIVVADRDGNVEEVGVPDLELVVVVGERVLATSSALITLLSNGVPVVFVSGRSDAYGVLYDAVQVGTTNVREAQYRCFSDERCAATYARPVIYSKIRGLLNVLKYEYKYYRELMEGFEDAKLRILEVLEFVEKAGDVEELRRLESVGSKYFWNIAVNLIPKRYAFSGREPRRCDVINSSIDFLYAVLYGLTTKSLVSSGLDPYYGLIHVLKPGRTSLTYDLSELFKPLAIHTVIQTSRKTYLRTLRGSRLLSPKTTDALIRHLYSKLSKESEKHYKRKSIWTTPMREANKFKNSLIKQTPYDPYIYDPPSGT